MNCVIIIKNFLINDVLFINGTNTNLKSDSYIYSVLHHIEQLNASNLESSEIFYLKINPLIVCNFRIIIFFKCPRTKEVDKAITLAKKLNKKVLFDTDDLFFDAKYTNTKTYIQEYSLYEKPFNDKNIIQMKITLSLCEAAITTNEIIAKELKNYISEVFINHNVASEEMWKLSENALENKMKNSSEIIIGYYNDNISDNSNIKIIVPYLTKIILEFKNVKLLFLGEQVLPNDLKDFSSQIIIKKFIDKKKIPELFAGIDINIIPLKNCIINEAKSEN